MCKNLQNKILISLLAAGSLGICSFTNPAAAAAVTVDNNLVTSHNNEAIATDADFNGYDYLKAHSDNEITVSNTNLNNFTGVGIGEVFNGQYTPFQNNRIVLTNSDIKGKVTGVSIAAYYPSVQNVNLKIINTNVADGITVADISSYSEPIKADNIKLSLEGNSEISGDVVLVYRGTWAHYDLQTQNNEIILKDAVNVENADLYAFASTDNTYGQNPPGTITSDDATLTLDGWSGKIGSLHDFNIINFDNIDFSNNNILDITGTAENMENVQININSISAGDYAEGTTNFTISWDSDLGNNVTIDESLTAGKFDTSKYYITNRKSAEDGIYITKFTKAEVTDNNPNDNSIEISATVAKSILAGKFIDENGIHYNSNQTADTASLTIGDGFTTEVGTVAGVYAVNKSDDIAQDATSGMVNINGSIDWNGNVYAGYSESGAVNNNTINAAAGTKAPNINLSGYNTSGTGNTLNIAGNGSVFNSIEKFDTINFDGVNFNSDAALTVTSADVSGAIININSLAGGQTFNVGDTQTLLSSANVFTGSGLANDIVTAGLVQDVEFSAAQSEDNKSIDLRVEKVSTNKQIDLVAENRAVAAAFVNQGTDLISDSLDTLSRDGNHGVKTFAAVHGNRSKYDVNSDLKINGWSTIVGIGNAAEFADGDEFSWGVFY